MSILVLLVLLIGLLMGTAQSFETRGRVTNSVYAYDDGESHTRLYQTLRFQMNPTDNRDFQFNFYGRILNDLNSDVDLDEEIQYNAYRLSLEANGLFNNFLDLEIGRQFLHPGLVLGSLDGVNAVLHPGQNIDWQIYGGVESHFFESFKVYEAEDAMVLGTAFKLKDIMDSDIEAVYIQKNGPDDAIGDEEPDDGTQWQLAGANLKNHSIKGLNLYMQAHYDLINERLHRFYTKGTYKLNQRIYVSADYKQQYPQIYDGSYYNREDLSTPFGDFERYQQMGFNAAYFLNQNCSLNLGYRYLLLYNEDDAALLTATIDNANGSIGLVYEDGDLGDQIGVMADYGYEIFNNLMASVSVDYTRYRTEDCYCEGIGNSVEDYDRAIGSALRLSYKFNRHLRIDAEYQNINGWLSYSPDDTQDHRFLNHISYIW